MDADVTQAVKEAVEATVAEAEQAPVEPEGTAPPKEEDVPTSWMGVDLSDLPADKRQAAIDAFGKQESYIGRLQQRVAEKKAGEPQANQPPQAPQPDTPEPSDDDVMKALGYSPDMESYEVVKQVAVPLAKQMLLQAGEIEQVKQQLQVEAAWDHWNVTLDGLEDQYGELPVSREALVEFAVEEGIDNPEVAYYRLAMQAQKMTAEAAQVQRLARADETRGLKRQVGSGVKPAGNPPTSGTPFEPTGNLTSDIKAAAAEAEKELGVSWDGAAAAFLGR